MALNDPQLLSQIVQRIQTKYNTSELTATELSDLIIKEIEQH